MSENASIFKRLYAYQAERFPIFILALSLFPAILSSGAVVSSSPSLMRGVLVLLASLAYLLHIRVIDEKRDFEHDNIHHGERPLQQGVVTKAELHDADGIAVLVLVAVAAFSGPFALFTAGVMLGYSYLAGKEFFLGESLRKRFFVYNAVNLLQMFLMQGFVYAVFAGTIPTNSLVAAHFSFTAAGTLAFEFVRKLKVPGDDGTGEDTYTWYLGFTRALWIMAALNALIAALFYSVIVQLGVNASAAWLSLCILGITLIAAALHGQYRSRATDKLLQLSVFCMYALLNIVIYTFTS